jgi:hypothetical protein
VEAGRAEGQVELVGQVVRARAVEIEVAQMDQRRGVAARQRLQRGGQRRPDRSERGGELHGVVDAQLADVDHLDRRAATLAADDLRPADVAAPDAPDRRVQRGRRVVDGLRARPGRADLAQHARHRGDPVQPVRLDRVQRDRRVQDQPRRPLGEAARVLAGDARPVGDPEQRDLLEPECRAQRLDVARGLGGGQERPLRPEPLRALAREFEHPAARVPGVAGPALVDEHDVVRRPHRRELERDLRRVAHGRFARPAREEHDGPRPRPARGQDGVGERHGSRRCPGVVERHPERPAARLLRARRGRRGGEQREQRQGEQERHGTAERTPRAEPSTPQATPSRHRARLLRAAAVAFSPHRRALPRRAGSQPTPASSRSNSTASRSPRTSGAA